MSRAPADRRPTLAQRHIELRALALPGARIALDHRKLTMDVKLAPGSYGRLYDCRFIFERSSPLPLVIVTQPELPALAAGQTLPHVYPWEGRGTRLCLWWPKGREWHPQLKVAETLIPWTAEWLYYFEVWLLIGAWTGGGDHPAAAKRKRWAPPAGRSTSTSPT